MGSNSPSAPTFSVSSVGSSAAGSQTSASRGSAVAARDLSSSRGSSMPISSTSLSTTTFITTIGTFTSSTNISTSTGSTNGSTSTTSTNINTSTSSTNSPTTSTSIHTKSSTSTRRLGTVTSHTKTSDTSPNSVFPSGKPISTFIRTESSASASQLTTVENRIENYGTLSSAAITSSSITPSQVTTDLNGLTIPRTTVTTSVTTTKLSVSVSITTDKASSPSPTATSGNGANSGSGVATFFRRHGAIAGVSVGVIVATSLLCLWIFFMCRRRFKRFQRQERSPNADDGGRNIERKRRSMLMAYDEDAARARFRPTRPYSNEKPGDLAGLALQTFNYKDFRPASEDSYYDDSYRERDSEIGHSLSLSTFPNPSSDRVSRSGLRKRSGSIPPFGRSANMKAGRSRNRSLSPEKTQATVRAEPPPPTQGSPSYDHSSISHADAFSPLHELYFRIPSMSHEPPITTLFSHEEQGKGKPRALPPSAREDMLDRPSSSGSGGGSFQEHSWQNYSSPSSTRPGSSDSGSGFSVGCGTSLTSTPSLGPLSTSLGEDVSFRSSRNRRKVQSALHPPPLSRAEVASRKANVSSISPSYHMNNPVITPTTIGAFPQNFSPPSKAILPQLRTITPSPPVSHRSGSPPASPSYPEHIHILEDIDEYEDRLYDSRLDPRTHFRENGDTVSLPPPSSDPLRSLIPKADRPRGIDNYAQNNAN